MSEYIVDFGNSMAMLSRIIESPSAWLCGEIVRCRDCVNCYFDISSWMCGEFGFGVGNEDNGEPDGYCAWAVKRKEGGDD